MWNSAMVMMLVKETFRTIYMVLTSTLFAYLLGLPMGIALDRKSTRLNSSHL